MDVLLINGRGDPGRPHPSIEQVPAVCAALVDAGHTARWLCLLGPDDPVPTARDAVGLRVSRAPHRPFRSVQKRLSDVDGERALTDELRREPPDCVHLFAIGGSTSPMLPWICDRLGVPVIVEVGFAEAVCHRGTLIDETGATCPTWDDPDRCTVCCTTPSPGGPTRAQGILARALAMFGGLSPFPDRTDFLNRLDVVVYGLSCATRVVVGTETAAAALRDLGVPSKLVEVVDRERLTPESRLALYDPLRARPGPETTPTNAR